MLCYLPDSAINCFFKIIWQSLDYSDQATASIDSHSEELIKKPLKKLPETRPPNIAHRLATIKNADRIIVMDKGNIVEVGTHKELLRIPEGFYAQLHKVQFMEVEETL